MDMEDDIHVLEQLHHGLTPTQSLAQLQTVEF